MRKIFNFIGQAACLLILVSAFGAAAHGQIAADVAIMQNLRDNHGFGQAFPGWSTTTVPCPSVGANWAGVTCSANRVAIIAVGCGSTPLTASFPGTEIAGLTGFLSLEIRGCYLNPQPASNFAALDTMTQLTRIRLDFNSGITGNLSDVFPQGLSPTRFPALTTFQVEVTSLGGQIPAGVMEFNDQRVIRLFQMRLSGTLPATGNPAKNLLINGNALEGVLPDYIRNASGLVRLGYNKFDVVNTPAGTIDTIDPGWRTTQTVPPTNVQIAQTGAGTATVSWTPIAYTAHGGYYEVLSSTAPGGPYTSRGTTAASGAKTATGLTVSGLPAGTNYFVVRTFTPAHTRETIICSGISPVTTFCGSDNNRIAPNNPNDLTSVLSAEASASVPPPLTVTKTADTDGTCNSGVNCSLREAIAAANATGANDSIVFAIPPSDANCPNGVCTITLGGSQLVAGDAATAGSLTITNQTGAMNLRVSGNMNSRVFRVNSGGNLTIEGLTVRDGNGTDATQPADNGNGGGILSSGTLTLNRVAVINNSAADFNGAIGSFAPLTINNSTIADNICFSTGGSTGGIGTAADLTVTNSTVSGNSMPNGSANSAGGIWANANLTVVNSTVTDNQGFDVSGIRNAGAATFTLRNTIIAGNRSNSTAPDVVGAFAGNNNLIGNVGTATGLTGSGNQTGTSAATLNPLLAPLGFYGGTTLTHALTATSPAVNAASNSEIQSVTPPASGTFRLTFNGFRLTPGVLAFDASPATVQAALIGNSLTIGAGAGNVSVTKPGASYIIAFQGTLADTNLPQIISTGSANDPIIQTIVDGKTAPSNDQRAASRVGALDIGSFELNNSANGGNFVVALPNARQSTLYNFVITPNNGTFAYSVTGGALPAGIGISSSFAPEAVIALTGTTMQSGTFNFAVTATDGTNPNVTNYRLNVLAPTAANVSIGGRVMIGKGRGLANARVYLTDLNGETRMAATNPFGYYRFADIAAGQTVIVTIVSKRYRFAPQVVSAADDIEDLNFYAEF